MPVYEATATGLVLWPAIVGAISFHGRIFVVELIESIDLIDVGYTAHMPAPVRGDNPHIEMILFPDYVIKIL